MYRLSHPPVHVATSPTAEALEEQPACRLGAGYSWRKPFLRRPPSTLVRTGEACAKNETHPYQSKDQDCLMRRYVKRW